MSHAASRGRSPGTISRVGQVRLMREIVRARSCARDRVRAGRADRSPRDAAPPTRGPVAHGPRGSGCDNGEGPGPSSERASSAFLHTRAAGRDAGAALIGMDVMDRTVWAGAAALGVIGLAVAAAPARASGYDDGFEEAYDAPFVSRRVVIERPAAREVVVERRVVVRPRPVVREVIVERPVVVRPRPVVREVVVERDRFAPPPYRPRPVGFRYGYGPGYDPYE